MNSSALRLIICYFSCMCVCVYLRFNLEIFPFYCLILLRVPLCVLVLLVCVCVCFGVSKQFQLFILFRESVGELSPDDVLFSSRASGKLETEPERDVTFV